MCEIVVLPLPGLAARTEATYFLLNRFLTTFFAVFA